WATGDGRIAGWSPAVDLTHAIVAVDHSAAGAIYKGLALVTTPSGPARYATTFHDAKVEVYDSQCHQVNLGPRAFFDQTLPRDFAPFGIQNIGGNLFVTYAQQIHPEDKDDKAGPHKGFVDEFDPSGHMVRRFATRGTLDSPWGVAQVPAN